jgi:hypothetical protein
LDPEGTSDGGGRKKALALAAMCRKVAETSQ